MTTIFDSILTLAEPLTPPDPTADLLQWLAKSERQGEPTRDTGLQWLLATTFTDVIWGKNDGGWKLSTATPDLPAAGLPAAGLLELRAFGPDAEIFIWRDAGGLRARRRSDGAGDPLDYYPEEQLLWGTVRLEGAPTGFTRLAEGDQGLVHAPPLALDPSYFAKELNEHGKPNKHYGHRPARLILRHYVGRDKDTGLARVIDSRLVAVQAKRPEEA